MRLGIGSYSLAWNIGVPGSPPPSPIDHFELLAIAAQAGMSACQYCENLSVNALTAQRRQELLARARDLGIVVEVGTRGIDSDEITRCAEVAAQSGAGFVRLVIDKGRDEPSVDESLTRLSGCRKIAEDHGLKIAIENHDRFPARTLASMIERLGKDAFAVCLDTANSLGSLEGTEHVVAALAPYTVNLHVKDVRARRVKSMMGFVIEGTAAGEGQLDIPWLLQTVHAESATIEHWPMPDAGGEPPFTKEREMLKRSVAYMRALVG
jgi:sugar phosphate isomerase/epimerase